MRKRITAPLDAHTAAMKLYIYTYIYIDRVLTRYHVTAFLKERSVFTMIRVYFPRGIPDNDLRIQ